MKYTYEEIEEECRVIIQTRLGCLCEDRPPTEEQLEIAQAEANEWKASQLPNTLD